MACFNPLDAWRTVEGAIVFDKPTLPSMALKLSCGQCRGCRLERSRVWGVRASHEAKCWSRNAFVTLTFSDEHLPSNGSISPADLKNFIRRLRAAHQGHDRIDHPDFSNPYPIRYMGCGEYGENPPLGAKFGRPHYHVCLFNFDFDDKVVWSKNSNGDIVYRSAELERLWPFGHSTIGEVTHKSAAYTARYVMKKINGSMAVDHYGQVEGLDPETGEIITEHEFHPEFFVMSRKPGIGALWFDKYQTDVFPHDHVIIDGHPTKPPRYYSKLFIKQSSDEEVAALLDKRQARVKASAAAYTPQSLAAKEEVFEAKTKYLRRGL